MKIHIEFFKENFIDALSAGIYEIDALHNGNKEVLYIGESVFVLIRCATHLCTLNQNGKYFGFTDDQLNDENITLVFHLLENETNTTLRKSKEKDYIKDRNPITQSGISDRMKDIDEKLESLNQFLRQ